MKEKNKVKKIKIIIFLLVLSIIFLLFPSKQLVIAPAEQEHYAGDTLYDSILISQDIKVPDNYKGLVFFVGTYMKVIEDGEIKVEIINSEEKTIYKKSIDMRTVVDSAAVYLDVSLEKNKLYTIKLKTNGIKKDMPITLYRIDNNKYKAKQNNETEKNSLDIRYYYNKNSYFNIWYIPLLAAIIYVYNCLENTYSREVVKDEK